ncbi:MAG: KAP family NTPase [Propionibacteriaceae bacterium]|jgi:hypothetical protein|nr:KAP family NTPase [Propionibacteriaceae bacterium]
MIPVQILDTAAKEVIERVHHLADDVDRDFLDEISRDDCATARALDIALKRIVEPAHHVSLHGARGSGKSSVLKTVLETLAQDEHGRFVVLPPVSPELLNRDTNLIDVLLAALDYSIPRILPEHATPLQAAGLHEAVANARRSSALNQITSTGRRTGAATAVDLERMIEASAGGTERLWLTIQVLIAQVVNTKSTYRAVIVSVDDFDLAPVENEQVILTTLRTFSSLQGVIVITTADPADLIENAPPAMTQAGDKEASGIQRASRDYLALQHQYEKDRNARLKTLPLGQLVKLPPVPWSDRRLVAPFHKGQESTIGQSMSRLDALMSKACGLTILERNLLVNDPIAERLRLKVRGLDPLPSNLRLLSYLSESLAVLSATLPNFPTELGIQAISQSLFQTIQQPFGASKPPQLDWVADYENEENTSIVSFDFSGIRSSIKSGRWTSDDARSSTVTVELRPIDEMLSRWNVGETTSRQDPLSNPGDYGIALAIQGILLDATSGSLESGDTPHTFGLGQSDFAWCQSISINKTETDDRFLSLPLCSNLRTTMRSLAGWNAITERHDREHLRIDQLMALTIHAAIDIFFKDTWFVAAEAETDYEKAMEDLSAAVSDCLARFSREGSRKAGDREHLVDWYCYWVPSHWHESFFSPLQITAFIHTIKDTMGVTSFTHKSLSRFNYVKSAVERIRDTIRTSGTGAAIEENQWCGGYRTLVEVAEVVLNPEQMDTFRELITAYDRHATRRSLGSHATSGSTSNREPDNGPEDWQPPRSPSELREGFTGETNPPPDEAEFPRLAQALTDFTVQQLRRWPTA